MKTERKKYILGQMFKYILWRINNKNIHMYFEKNMIYKLPENWLLCLIKATFSTPNSVTFCFLKKESKSTHEPNTFQAMYDSSPQKSLLNPQ